jgi:hypothetical protein
MELVAVADQLAASELREITVIAADLGFSTNGASCGLAWTLNGGGAENRNFGRTVAHVAELLLETREAVLILEAPLSARFGERGNPRSRGAVEDAPSATPSQTRYWSHSPGIGMAFAAMLFLRKLEGLLSEHPVDVHLVEGFVSRGVWPQHRDVAIALRGSFLGELEPLWHTVEQSPGDEIISVLQLLDPTKSATAPIILEPQETASRV